MGKLQLPIALKQTYSPSAKGITLPLNLPMSFKERAFVNGIQLPVTLPFSFGKISSDKIFYNKKLKIIAQPQPKEENKVYLRISEKPSGAPNYLPISETVWYFPGLIVEENIVTSQKESLLVDERIFSQIIANFELLSPSQLKVSWSGARVPRVEIYMKNREEEDYTLYNSYTWNRGSAIIPIIDNNYYIKLEGIRESGSSGEYLISPSLQIGITPELSMVNKNDKIYNVDINYISEYKVDIKY